LQSKVYQKIKTMPIKVDLSKDPMFIEVKEQGREQGIELATGAFVRNMLRANQLSIQEMASIANTSIDFVLKIKKEMESEKKGGQK
jgi:predicted transposase YdaD